ncbi:MAG: protein translocase subunit SecF [Candidatus Pacearchaeota archaeon]
MENNPEKIENNKHLKENWYDRYYKILLIIPVIILILSLSYIGYFFYKHKVFFLKDTSLSGGTTITFISDISQTELEKNLNLKFSDISIRKLTDITGTGKSSYIIESSANSEELKKAIEDIIGTKLTEENSTIEFTGPSLSKSFYKQLIIALLISFTLMSITVFIIFRTFIPSIAVIFAAFSDIVMSLALINLLGIKLSAAGIAAFLMLIGYSVDTDILLTTRALKTKLGNLNQRIFRAFKTGIFMTITALAAVLPAFLINSGLPSNFMQIFFILSLGLTADIINTWLTNASIIKWYCVKKKIE